MKFPGTVILLGACALMAAPLVAAQRSGQSLAEKAQKVRQQEKTAPRATIVWTNDNLPTAGNISIVGKPELQASAASATGVATAGSKAKGNASAAESAQGPSAEDFTNQRAELQWQLDDAKNALESAQTDLNIARREYKLDSDQYYSQPDYSSDRRGQAKLNADQAQITAKQAEADAAQEKATELQNQLKALDAKISAAKSPRSSH